MGKLRAAVEGIYKPEKKFITELFKRLPKGLIGSSEEAPEEDYIIEEEEATIGKGKKEKFEQGLKDARKNRSFDREELQRRLHAKLAELGKDRIENQNSALALRRKKQKVKKAEEAQTKKKRFTSAANPNLGSGGGGSKAGTPKSVPSTPAGGTSVQEKTPLQKKPVKKTNGEIVYSKFDFISDDKKPQEFTLNKKATSAAKTLAAVQKREGYIEKLKSAGKTSEAVTVAEKQKWNNALQRAKGTKVKDDPTLLKKTIKKEEKIKKVKQKKWKERVETQEKFKQQRQTKRDTNIQKRKDDKIKRVKKGLRKKGRIA